MDDRPTDKQTDDTWPQHVVSYWSTYDVCQTFADILFARWHETFDTGMGKFSFWSHLLARESTWSRHLVANEIIGKFMGLYKKSHVKNMCFWKRLGEGQKMPLRCAKSSCHFRHEAFCMNAPFGRRVPPTFPKKIRSTISHTSDSDLCDISFWFLLVYKILQFISFCGPWIRLSWLLISIILRVRAEMVLARIPSKQLGSWLGSTWIHLVVKECGLRIPSKAARILIRIHLDPLGSTWL